MKDFFRKTFGGLNTAYYLRHLFFGGAICVLFFCTQGFEPLMATFLIISALLYPYACFVYESVVGFIMGDNVFFVNGYLFIVKLFIKFTICFMFAIFVAPLGLIFLYFYHSKQEKLQQSQEEQTENTSQ